MSEQQVIDDAGKMLCARVIELRKKNKLTLNQLSGLSGVSRSMLSQIERGQANPTLAVAFRIAQAFGMSIGELIDQHSHSPSIEIVHGTDPNNWFRRDEACQIRTLSPLHMEKNVEFYELRLARGASLESAAHFDGAKELLTVVQGQAHVVAGQSECVLVSGDSAHYRADLSHCISSEGEDALVAYLVVTYQ